MSGVRRAVELFFTRVIASRYGAALLLALVVLVVLAATRLLAGASPDATGAIGAPAEPIPTGNPTAGNDSLATSPKPPPSPKVAEGEQPPLEVARKFAEAWLRTDGVSADEWHRGLRKYSTQDLRERLDGADPAGVPADRIADDLTLIPRGTDFAEVTVPLDSGRLILRLIAPDDRWLVDGVDWERA